MKTTVAVIAGVLVMAATASSFGLLSAIIAGAIVGGVVGAMPVLWHRSHNTGQQSNDSSQPSTEEAALIETRTRLDAVKRISVPRNELDCLSKIIAGIEKGESGSHWQLGEAYLRGKLVLWNKFPKDKQAALFWFRRSAELGEAYSQYHLGVMYLGDIASELRMEYFPGDLIEKNPEEALRWLSKAADQSDTFAVFAQDVLGEMYFSGIAVNPDHEKAFNFFSKVVANPNNLMAHHGLATRATERLPELEAKGHKLSAT